MGANGAGCAGAEPFPPPLNEAAYHGVMGEIVREIAPHTEADPAGILAVLLSGIGNALGRSAHALVMAKPHHARLNVILVGPSRTGAKGSAQSAAEAVLGEAVPGWHRQRRVTGLSTGEGLIKAVRDPRIDKEPIRDKAKNVIGYQEVMVDAGVEDKRLWVVEEEFAKVIKVMARESNTLSAIIRDAWDGGNLQTLTSGNPSLATDPHIAIVGHITPIDLKKYLQSTEIANGFANRFLWFMVRRVRLLPDGDTLDPGRLRYWGELLGGSIRDARERLVYPLRRDVEARAKWHAVYGAFGRVPDGVLGTVLSRAEAQVLRLSVLYAALDVSPRITLAHLDAALAVWTYVHNSALCIFGDATEDPVIDTVVAALRDGPKATAELSNRFNRNIPQLGETLELLEDRGMLRSYEIATKGRPRTMWALAEAEAD
jgi:hypothetical protein